MEIKIKMTFNILLLLLLAPPTFGFVLPQGSTLPTTTTNPNTPSTLATTSTTLWSSLKDKTEETVEEAAAAASDSTTETTPQTPDAEGLPWWWELVWKLNIMKTGQQGEEIIFGDSANVLRTNIEQIYGGYPSLDGCPLAEGEITDIGDGTMFIGLQNYFQNYGSPYKLCFGPKSFLVISDPIQARHLLRDANKNYDKVSTNRCGFVVMSVQLTLSHSYLTNLLSIGRSGRDPETHHGERLDSSRSRNMEDTSSPNRSCFSQKVVGIHGGPFWIL
jgi:hypothetical protein